MPPVAMVACGMDAAGAPYLAAFRCANVSFVGAACTGAGVLAGFIELAGALAGFIEVAGA